MLRCIQACCSALQQVAVCYSVLQCVAVLLQRQHMWNVCVLLLLLLFKISCCSVLQCVAACGSVLQCFSVCFSVWQCVAVSCSVLQCVAVWLRRQHVMSVRECARAIVAAPVPNQVLQCVAV